MLEFIYNLPILRNYFYPPQGLDSATAEHANVLATILRRIFPLLIAGENVFNQDPSNYIPDQLFKNVRCSEKDEKILDRLACADWKGISSLVFTIQKVYFYIVAKPTLKRNRKLSDEEIRMQAHKAREIAEGAIKDVLECKSQMYFQSANDLLPYIPKIAIKIELTDEVFNVKSDSRFLEYLTIIAPSEMTKNIKKILTYMSKYTQIWESLSDFVLTFKAHKLASRDLDQLLWHPWRIDLDLVKRAKTIIFEKIECDIEEYEAERGEILI